MRTLSPMLSAIATILVLVGLVLVLLGALGRDGSRPHHERTVARNAEHGPCLYRRV